MERNAVITFAGQLREARESALRDCEAFDGILYAVERLGSFLYGKIKHLGAYQSKIEAIASDSPLAETIPCRYPSLHVPFSRLYDLIKEARNDALHQGAFARRLTSHSIEISLVLEDALRRNMSDAKVSDYMVRNPTFAELWQPISFIRQQMLANSFSFLPVKMPDGAGWSIISDLEIAAYLGTDTELRKARLAQSLQCAKIPLKETKPCGENTTLEDALRRFGDDQRPLFVSRDEGDHLVLAGILTPFDLL